MEYRAIDLERWPRREHFAYFSAMADPYVGVTAEADITDFLSAIRGAGLPFFLSFLYCAGRAGNAVPQLRQRIVDGAPVEMTPKEYDLFFYLVKNRNIALSREKLLSDVWGYDFYGDERTLDTHIKLLRKSLGPYSGRIVTLRGVGYRFEG